MPIAALTATVATLEARDGTTPTTIQSDAAITTSTPGSSPAASPSPPTTVSTPPATTAPGVVSAPVSVTKGAPAASLVPPLLARLARPAVDAPTSAIPSVALAAYQRAASVIDQADGGCNLDWQLLAAIGQVESGNGTSGGSRLSTAGIATPAIYGPVLNGRHHTARVADTDSGAIDGDKRLDRAVGPMQILPATWVQIGVDGDGDGRRDPQDINDAALAAAVYLCSTGTDLSHAAARQAAVLRYNHSTAYATEVLTLASSYLSDDQDATIPATYLVPPPLTGGAPDTPAASGKADRPGRRHGHKHHATHIKQVKVPSHAAPQPTKQPTKQPVSTRPPAATAAQLDDLCRAALVQSYPSATDDAIAAATAECAKDLAHRTLAQAREQLDAVVTDPKLALDIPALGPLAPTTPTTTPTGTPSGAPTQPSTGTPSDGSSDATDPSTGSAGPSAPASSDGATGTAADGDGSSATD